MERIKPILKSYKKLDKPEIPKEWMQGITVKTKENLVGEKINNLTVLSQGTDRINKDGSRYAQWICQCSCENKTLLLIDGAYLKRKTIKDCGCSKDIKKNQPIKIKEDLTGKEFGRWKVLRRGKDYIIPSNGSRKPTWICQCSCENKTIREIVQSRLVTHQTLSCGCYGLEQLQKGRKELGDKIYYSNRKLNENGEVIQKRCSLCKEWKDITNFPKIESERDGTSSICEFCYRYKMYISDAKRRKYEFQLTLEQFTELIKKKCYYCDSFSIDKNFSGVDRIDSTKGYFLENCVSCCNICNLMKNNITPQTWIEQINKIYQNLIRSGKYEKLHYFND